MKEIWINLELYFESYEFSNFRDFFQIFLNLFSIFKVLKTMKKGQKGVILSRRTHVDATWHARPRGKATRTHMSACVARM